MAHPTVIVTRRWPAPVEAELTRRYPRARLNASDRPLGADGLRAALCEAEIVLPTVCDSLPGELFDGPVKTRFLGNFGVGYNHIDTAAAAKHGIVVTNTPGVLTDATADTAMTLLLMIARRAGEGEREVREGRWDGWRPTHMMGADVTGKTIGIIGMGRIGKAVARQAHFGFACPSSSTTPAPRPTTVSRAPASSHRSTRCWRTRTSSPCTCPAAHATGNSSTPNASR